MMKNARILSKIALTFMLIFALVGIEAAAFRVVAGSYAPAFVVVNSQSDRRPTRISAQGEVQLNPEGQTKLYPVSTGSWGGQSVSFVVEKNAVKIEFDCAQGEIPMQLKTNKMGNFTVNGTYMRDAPGPIRRDQLYKPEPARYEGKITGKVMKLKVTLIKTNETIGEFTTERGRVPVLSKCL